MTDLSDSILSSTKKVLGIAEDYTAFDPDIVMHINSVFSTLCQLGIGPEAGFMIEDDSATWFDFLRGDSRLNSVKSYMFLRVRVLFDPPTTSFLQDSMRRQIEEFEWRLNVAREFVAHPMTDELDGTDEVDDTGEEAFLDVYLQSKV